MDRAQLFDDLSHLSSQDFERLLVGVNMPRMNRAGAAAKIGEQVSALLEWADSSIGPGLSDIQNYLDKMKSDSLPTAFDFSQYLQFLCRDPRFQDVRDFYTETEVLIPLEAETVGRRSPIADTNSEAEQTQQKVERFPVLKGLRDYALGDNRQHLLLAGRPGSGKSTTLKCLLLKTAEAALDHPDVIPVYVQLKGDRPITDLIIAEFRCAKVRVAPEQLDDWLLQDRLLLLLDGVNEIPSDQQRRKLQEFREDNPTAPMIFTTRDLAAGGDLGIEKRLEMRPLSETQMREFVQKYLPNHAEILLRQLKDRLREVAETPLLLKMLCDVFDPATEQIPQSKGELFRLFDSKYDKFKGLIAVSDDFRRFKPELLQHLAFSMLQGDPAKPTEPWLTLDRNRAERLVETYLTDRIEAPGQQAKEWLENLLEHHLLQVASDPKEIEFHHQLFQEYYAAEALLLKLAELLEDEANFKCDYLNYLKWTEVIALMLALVKEESQALQVVKLAMDNVDLILGARLAGNVKPPLQRLTIDWINTLDIPIHLKIQCWVTSHSEEALPNLLKALEYPDSNVRESVAVALGEIGNEAAISGLLTILEDPDGYVRESVAVALGEIGGEAAIPGLLSALEDPDNDVRRSVAEALGMIGSKAVIPGLLNALEDPDGYVRWSAAEALRIIGDETIVSDLLTALEDPNDDIRRIAAALLGRIGTETAIPSLLSDLEDPDGYIRRSAAEALGIIGSEVAIPNLLRILEDPDNFVRGKVAEALGNISSEAAIPGLLSTLEDPDNFVRWNAVEALGKIGSEAVIPGLLNALEDPDDFVHWSAAEALGKVRSEAALPGLLNALEHPDDNVRGRATIALGNIGSKAAVPGLLSNLKDPDTPIRWGAAEALGEIGSEAAIPGLLNALEDPDNFVRWKAAEALGKIGGEEAAPGLLNALKDPSYEVRGNAAEALSNIGGEKTILSLLSALEDPSSYVRVRAAEALGKIGSEAAIPGLLSTLGDPDTLIRWGGAEALGKIGSASRLNILWQLYFQQPENHLGKAISAIQDRCKFYNYEIWQDCLARQQGDSTPSQSDKTIANTITIQTVEKLTIMSDKAPIFNQQHATIGVNYAAEGSQQDFTQHIHASEQNFEILLTGYKHFIDGLQQQNSHLTNETAIIQTIEIEARRIDTRWQNFLNLKRLWNGGKKQPSKSANTLSNLTPGAKARSHFSKASAKM